MSYSLLSALHFATESLQLHPAPDVDGPNADIAADIDAEAEAEDCHPADALFASLSRSAALASARFRLASLAAVAPSDAEQTLDLSGLILSESRWGGGGGTLLGLREALAAGVEGAIHLHALRLAGCSLGPAEAASLAEGLHACRTVRVLGLRANALGPEGVEALASGLRGREAPFDLIDLVRLSGGPSSMLSAIRGLSSPM